MKGLYKNKNLFTKTEIQHSDTNRLFIPKLNGLDINNLKEISATDDFKSFTNYKITNIELPYNIGDIFNDGSCIAYYPLDGNANDFFGNYNGTWHGNEQYDTGKIGLAAKFDGSSYIYLGNLDSIFSNNSYTVSAWLNLSYGTFLNLRNLSAADNSSSNCKGGLLWIDSGELYFYVKGTDDSTQIEKVISLGDVTDKFWLCTIIHNKNTKTVSLYINSQKKTEVTYQGSLQFSDGITGYLGVHRYSSDFNYYAKGLIDQVRIFNRALSEQEVKFLYEEDKRYLLTLNKSPTQKYFIIETNSKWISKPLNQEDSDKDWYQYQVEITETSQDDNNKPIEPTNSSFAIPNIIIPDKDSFVVSDGTNVKLLNPGDYNIDEFIDNTHKLDIFGDGSCIACYTFDGNANDLSGKYNGTWVGNEQYDVGKFGKAAKFDGSSGVASSVSNGLTNECTISLWLYAIKPELSSDQEVFNAGSEIYELEIYKSKFRIAAGNDWHWADTGYTVASNKWYHIVAYYNRVTGKYLFYVNKQLVKSINNSSSHMFGYNNDGITFGFRRDDSSRTPHAFLYGLIDQVRIFNRALTEEEIQILYNEQLQKITLKQPLPNKIQKVTKPIKVYISLESNENRCSVEDKDLTPTIENPTSNSAIVYTDKKDFILPNDIIIVNKDKEVKVKESEFLADIVNTLDVFGDGSCIACYPFDGNAKDLSGKYNGTWHGNEQYDVGRFGKAAKFDGSSCVEINNKPNVTDEITISMWIKPTHDGTKNTCVFHLVNTNATTVSEENMFNFWFSSDVAIRVNHNKYILQEYDIVKNKWNHYILVVSDKTKVYYNGNLIKIIDEIPDLSKFQKIYFGADWDKDNPYTDYFEGLIDQVRIFNRALIEDEVKFLYYKEGYKYKLTFDDIGTKVTSVVVPARVTEINWKDVSYDSSTDTIKLVSDVYIKRGRSIQIKSELSDGNSLVGMNINLWKLK